MLLQSHPSRVRGLKQKQVYEQDVEAKSHPSRVRGLKQNRYADTKEQLCRTLHGCVD